MVFASTLWTRNEDKTFENALLKYGEERPDRWEAIARELPMKTALDCEQHYYVLLADVQDIEAGLIEPPNYNANNKLASSSRKPRGEPRRPANQWTEDEHRRFLEGLKKFGKGDWKSIARQCVKTRSATQVASHAQKYFIHLEKDAKSRKRASIYDVSLD